MEEQKFDVVCRVYFEHFDLTSFKEIRDNGI